jgi:hypothetical protein
MPLPLQKGLPVKPLVPHWELLLHCTGTQALLEQILFEVAQFSASVPLTLQES